MTKRVAIFISGGGSNMLRLAEDMNGDHPARPVVIVSNVPDAGGIPAAARLGIPTITVDHKPFGKDRAAFEAELAKQLARFRPDIICLAGFMRVLTADFLRPWDGKMLNIHPSLLPKYKGLHTHQRALEAGDTEVGCTVHLVTPELDDGPILGQARVPVVENDTADTLAARVLAQEHKLYPAVLRRFAEGNLAPLML